MEPFSRRFDSLDIEGGETPLARLLAQYKRDHVPYWDLTESNPTHVGFDYPADRIRAALSDPAALAYRPEPRGMLQTREALTRYYAERGWDTSPETFFLTSGTSEAYAFLFKLLCNPGDSVLVPQPGYPLFDFIAELEHVELVHYRLDNPFEQSGEFDGRWRLDVDDVRRRITKATKAIVVVQPNNPTGSVLTAEEGQALLALAEEANVCLIVDEVFSDFCFEGTRYVPLRSSTVPIYTLNGFSKILGLPQMKLSWIHLEAEANYFRRAAEYLEIIADTFLSVNTPIQVAASALLALRPAIQRQIHARLDANLHAAESIIGTGNSLRSIRPEGGWYLVLAFDKVRDDEELALSLLRERQVYVHPGYMFGFDAGCYLIISLLTPQETFGEGLARIVEFAHT